MKELTWVEIFERWEAHRHSIFLTSVYTAARLNVVAGCFETEIHCLGIGRPEMNADGKSTKTQLPVLLSWKAEASKKEQTCQSEYKTFMVVNSFQFTSKPTSIKQKLAEKKDRGEAFLLLSADSRISLRKGPLSHPQPLSSFDHGASHPLAPTKYQ